MAFDVYAGTLTRFYTRGWENVVQRQARIDGTEYRMIYAGGDPGPPPPAAEVRGAVAAWRDGINRALAPHGCGEIEWSEEDDRPYFTDRPGWEGYSGLLLWAAYAQSPEVSPPFELPKSWADDPVHERVMADDHPARYAAILAANLWLPGDFPFRFRFPNLVEGDDVMISSTGGLLEQLRGLRAEEPRWGKPSLLSRIKRTGAAVPLEEAARVGMTVFSNLAEEAVLNRLPILLSF